MGNNHCGYYVMHYIHCYTGDDFSALEKQVCGSLLLYVNQASVRIVFYFLNSCSHMLMHF